MRPAIVPMPFDMPIRILAYRGAISRWFTLKPVVSNITVISLSKLLSTFIQLNFVFMKNFIKLFFVISL